MKKRIGALLLTLVLLLCVLPCAGAEGTVEAAETITVETLLSSCKDASLKGRTELVRALHDCVVGQMKVSIAQQEYDNAKSAQEDANERFLMGGALQAELDEADKALTTAKTALDKAQLEQLKRVTLVRGLTNLDIRDVTLDAQGLFLTLKPENLVLSQLQNAAAALSEDTEKTNLQLEQDYIDVTLSYTQIGTAASDYRTAVTARDDTAKALVMGKAQAAELKQATMAMKQARLTLFEAMSSYSLLLYSINETCAGTLSDQAGLLSAYLGTNA